MNKKRKLNLLRLTIESKALMHTNEYEIFLKIQIKTNNTKRNDFPFFLFILSPYQRSMEFFFPFPFPFPFSFFPSSRCKCEGQHADPEASKCYILPSPINSPKTNF